MYPGQSTRITESVLASAATIAPKTDLVVLSGSTAIADIQPNFLGVGAGVLFLVPTEGTLGLLTTGNIAIAVTMPQNQVTVLVYSKVNDTWYPGAIS